MNEFPGPVTTVRFEPEPMYYHWLGREADSYHALVDVGFHAAAYLGRDCPGFMGYAKRPPLRLDPTPSVLRDALVRKGDG